jgi:hypothetical protein
LTAGEGGAIIIADGVCPAIDAALAAAVSGAPFTPNKLSIAPITLDVQLKLRICDNEN